MKKIISLLLIISFLFSCNQKRKNDAPIDNFYADKGGFDLSRFPLIKPYQVETVIPSDEWIIQTADDDNEMPETAPGAKYVNVVDSVIFAHCKKTILDGQPTTEAWFIIIPKHHIFRGFKNHSEYLDYIKSIKSNEPKMYDVSNVFGYFDSKDTLNWKELNRTH